MKEHVFYISRQQTQDLLVKFVEALDEPDSKGASQFLFFKKM